MGREGVILIFIKKQILITNRPVYLEIIIADDVPLNVGVH